MRFMQSNCRHADDPTGHQNAPSRSSPAVLRQPDSPSTARHAELYPQRARASRRAAADSVFGSITIDAFRVPRVDLLNHKLLDLPLASSSQMTDISPLASLRPTS
jgi:hypothetical protein